MCVCVYVYTYIHIYIYIYVYYHMDSATGLASRNKTAKAGTQHAPNVPTKIIPMLRSVDSTIQGNFLWA